LTENEIPQLCLGMTGKAKSKRPPAGEAFFEFCLSRFVTASVKEPIQMRMAYGVMLVQKQLHF
jgi:hypothetical protein